jgi:crotonobetainyl-CoA:carnitine CoA-transferase CaiB-like acyl-CoA transferase
MQTIAKNSSPPGPLSGIKVLELGQFIAGPFAGTILGYFGAEVIKIEPLGGEGDQLRKFRDVDSTGTSYWWYSLGRNKKSVCIDLRKDQGQELVKQLAAKSDVLIENFKPGRSSAIFGLSLCSERLSNMLK